MGKKLSEIPADKLYVGMPVINDDNQKGSVVYVDNTDTVGAVALVKKDNGHFSFLHGSYLRDYSFDSTKG